MRSIIGKISLLCVIAPASLTGCALPPLGGGSATLRAKPGTPLAELRRQSTLDIGEGVKSMVETSRRRTFQQSKRFDWQLPDSDLLFRGCNSYSIYTDETGETIVDMQIGTAQKYLTWVQVKTEVLEIEQRFINDGWQNIVQRGQTSSDILHKQLENPNFTQLSDAIASTTYRKSEALFTLTAKRARGEDQPNIAEGENFLHFINIRFKRSDENFE